MPLRTIRRMCPLCGGAGGRILFEASDLNARVTRERFSLRRCDCGMAYLDPIPATPAEVYPASYDAHAAPAPKRRKSSRFASVTRRPGRLVDVGCGSGRDLLLLREKGWMVTGVEVSPEAAKRAREAGLDVRVGTLEEAALPAGSADVATLFHVLEHVADPVATAREVARVLAPGGVMLAHVPNFGSLNARLFREHWYELDVPRHVNFFTPRTLKRLVREAGLALRTLKTRAAAGDFRRSLQLKLGANPLRPLEGGLRVAAKMINLFRWGDVIEVVARKQESD